MIITVEEEKDMIRIHTNNFDAKKELDKIHSENRTTWKQVVLNSFVCGNTYFAVVDTRSGKNRHFIRTISQMISPVYEGKKIVGFDPKITHELRDGVIHF